mgnify:CR=1 FL=1
MGDKSGLAPHYEILSDQVNLPAISKASYRSLRGEQLVDLCLPDRQNQDARNLAMYRDRTNN